MKRSATLEEQLQLTDGGGRHAAALLSIHSSRNGRLASSKVNKLSFPSICGIPVLINDSSPTRGTCCSRRPDSQVPPAGLSKNLQKKFFLKKKRKKLAVVGGRRSSCPSPVHSSSDQLPTGHEVQVRAVADPSQENNF